MRILYVLQILSFNLLSFHITQHIYIDTSCDHVKINYIRASLVHRTARNMYRYFTLKHRLYKFQSGGFDTLGSWSRLLRQFRARRNRAARQNRYGTHGQLQRLLSRESSYTGFHVSYIANGR